MKAVNYSFERLQVDFGERGHIRNTIAQLKKRMRSAAAMFWSSAQALALTWPFCNQKMKCSG